MLQTLREHFGFDSLRDGQEPVIRALLEGRSSLAVFPTGGGKSLCYQLPALMLDGLTLVVSPLIALMRDQVEALVTKGIAAARLDSTLSPDELSAVYQNLENGSIKLLYIAPERFSNESFRQRIKHLSIGLVAIDEAHCISEWGHNFRPDYLKLAKICRRLKIPRVLALTATATPKVVRDIRREFRIASQDAIQLSFHRPNLYLRVTPCHAEERKSLLLEKIRAVDGSAVVYVTRQETAEEVATFLQKNGILARAYHAGLPDDFRADAQHAFMSGMSRVIVATIAFGMGIDKSDIRAVFHYNLPKSLENHTQEIGRAGRDGKAALCEMLACGDDLTVLENFIHSDTPTPRALENLIHRIFRLGSAIDVSPYDLSVACDIRAGVVSTVMAYLEIDGMIEAIGTYYDTWRVKLLQSQEKILNGRTPTERKRVQQILDSGEMKRAWLHIKPVELAEPLNLTRERITAVLSELHAAGDIALSLSGVRHSYQLRKAPSDLKNLAQELYKKFQTREINDLNRLHQVLGISAHRGCLTGYLTKHFGETLTAPCGHCDRCAGVPAKVIKRQKPRRPTDQELSQVKQIVDEKHAALTSPRQLARFLCGMSSPAAQRARLSRHEMFGLFSDLPFDEVIAIAGAVSFE